MIPHLLGSHGFNWVSMYANESHLTYSGYLITWPQMTFDNDMWPLTSWTFWFQSDSNFSNETNLTFAAYFTTWPQMTLFIFQNLRWTLTLVCDLWPDEYMKVPILYPWPRLVPIRLQLFKWGKFYIFNLVYNLTSDDIWPWYVTFDPTNKWGIL